MIKKELKELAFWLIVLIATAAALVIFNQTVYGDWTCTFKNCVIAKESK